MDARSLFREGVLAIRDQHDLAQGRQLLMQSLRLDPQNEEAWLWLTRTTSNTQEQWRYVERVLQINPENQTARRLKTKLVAPVIVPLADKLLQDAEINLNQGRFEEAIDRWLEVLRSQPDHPVAIQGAFSYLCRLDRWAEAKELIGRALTSGSKVPAVYFAALELAERDANENAAAALRERIAQLSSVDETEYLGFIARYEAEGQIELAAALASRIAHFHPALSKVALRAAGLLEQAGNLPAALSHYDQVIRLGANTSEGKRADDQLHRFGPVLMDRERGSVWLALREVIGISAVYFLLAWQDAGLNMFAMGPAHWIGLGMSIIGGYLLVTATSSPQQQPIARWLGGTIQHPQPGQNASGINLSHRASQLPILSPSMRWVLGFFGALILLIGAWFALHRSIDLFREDPVKLPWNEVWYE